MNLYKQYIAERENFNLLHGKDWFFTWQVRGSALFIADFYVTPEKRNTRMPVKVAKLIEDLGRAHKCSTLMAEVHTDVGAGEKTLKTLKKYGLNVVKKVDTVHLLSKEL